MPNAVRIVISGKVTGKTCIVPYSHSGGLQVHVVNRKPTNKPVIYETASYEVRIDGGGSYKAVRFGLQNKGAAPPPPSRRTDAGLSIARTCTPSWVPGYSPHSFAGGSRAGAWRLVKDKGFLIHEGADSAKGQVGGSLGCVEILDGAWNSFLDEIEKIGGAACKDLAAAKRITVAIEHANFPLAKLVSTP